MGVNLGPGPRPGRGAVLVCCEGGRSAKLVQLHRVVRCWQVWGIPKAEPRRDSNRREVEWKAGDSGFRDVLMQDSKQSFFDPLTRRGGMK